MPVHRLTGLLPWLLFNIILLFTGVSGSEPTVYSSAGEPVSLPCNHHGSFKCSSTTWTLNSGRSHGTIKLVDHGVVIDENQEIARRLRVGTNCSLHINNLTMADTGRYYCQLYHKGDDYMHLSVINLSILNIFASSPLTELKIGSTVTLVCKLHSSEPCGKSVRVSWVSETGAPLQGNRYKLSESECSSNLTVTLERSDRNMMWRCQLTEEGKLKASHSYTTIFPDIFVDGTYRELPARLVVFFLLLATPPIIGTIFYIRRRKHAQTDQMPSGPSLDYGNIEMLDRNAVPNFSVTQQNACNDL